MILDASPLVAILAQKPDSELIESVTVEQAHLAHEPLLFKGIDFKKTDIVSAL